MARKPRVRDHAAEYARLKARAQAAGLSTRGFRRARKQDPDQYYAPRAQVTLESRRRRDHEKRVFKETVIDAIVSVTAQRAPAHHTTDDLIDSAEQRVKHATNDQLKDFLKAYDEWVGNIGGDIASGFENLNNIGNFWIDDDLFFLLYYTD